MTLYELAVIYCDMHAVGTETRRTYLSTCSAMGNPTLDSIDAAWLEQQKTRGIAPRTWNTRLAHLRAMMGLAHQLHFIDSESAALRGVSKARRQTPLTSAINALVPGEYEKCLAGITDCVYGPAWYWRVVVEFFYWTGVRRRQLCEIRWSDIDLARGTVLLRHEGSKTMRQQMLPLHSKLITLLKEFKAALHAFGKPPIIEDQLFSWSNAWSQAPQKEMTPQTVSLFFHRLSRVTGIRISTHRLRHTFATRIARHTNNIKQVQFLLTHAKVETTMAYIHPSYEDMLKVLDYEPLD